MCRTSACLESAFQPVEQVLLTRSKFLCAELRTCIFARACSQYPASSSTYNNPSSSCTNCSSSACSPRVTANPRPVLPLLPAADAAAAAAAKGVSCCSCCGVSSGTSLCCCLCAEAAFLRCASSSTCSECRASWYTFCTPETLKSAKLDCLQQDTWARALDAYHTGRTPSVFLQH